MGDEDRTICEGSQISVAGYGSCSSRRGRKGAAIPVIAGRKSRAGTFAGAIQTYTIEAMMGDRKALQAGTSHNLGQNFSRAFGTQFTDEKAHRQRVWQTSWAVST
ncbi:hypothetical protein MUK42_10412 [Musa troglodytarum]|uniref:Uncharacterized protein n=1 Tax=Musa troglodytarum TaxID=320322 RepID=A0A9E7KFV6_9LILI|nr:hypothetical protein MUK42_10412 [Musa troglodytarum]